MNAPARPRRARGTGTIVPTDDGRFRARLPGAGAWLDPCDSYEAADRLLAEALHQIAERELRTPSGLTVGAWGRHWLALRERQGYSGVDKERDRWAAHVESTELGAMPLTAPPLRRDVIAWMHGRLEAPALPGWRHRTTPDRTVSRSVVKDALRLLRGAFQAALDAGHIDAHPCPAEGPHRVVLPKDPGRTTPTRTYLLPDEVPRLLADEEEPEEDRDAAEFAILTGLRQGEQWTLHLPDVRVEVAELTVRFGGRKGSELRPPKGGKIRTISLLPPAVAVIERQLARLAAVEVTRASELTRCRTCARSKRKHDRRDPSTCGAFVEPYPPRPRPNPHGLLWPSRDPTKKGGYRSEGRGVPGWSEWLERVGLIGSAREDGRDVEWHALRHTTATLLLAGRLPGCEEPPWPIERVCAYLGHSSIGVTQRYAHLAELLRRRPRPAGGAPDAGQVARELAAFVLGITEGVPERVRSLALSTLYPAASASVSGTERNHLAIPGRVELPTNGLGRRRC